MYYCAMNVKSKLFIRLFLLFCSTIIAEQLSGQCQHIEVNDNRDSVYTALPCDFPLYDAANGSAASLKQFQLKVAEYKKNLTGVRDLDYIPVRGKSVFIISAEAYMLYATDRKGIVDRNPEIYIVK